jgi:capsular exopolysaccharide synthesis family protein
MSKNFELMQRMGAEKVSAAAAEIFGSPRSATAPPVTSITTTGLDALAREESLKIVQRVFLQQGVNSPRVVIFAGVDPGNGCSRICAKTAVLLAANTSAKVCLVDANLRTPGLPELFGSSNHFGLTESLTQEGPIGKFLMPIEKDGIWLLSCGSLTSEFPNLLKADRLRSRIQELRKEFDYVLIDAPPLNLYADGTALAQLTDGLVLVLEANATRRETARRVKDVLASNGVPILGAVFNKRTFPIPESLYRKL